MREKSKAAYMISSVAEQYGVHPQTLRLYEREGLNGLSDVIVGRSARGGQALAHGSVDGLDDPAGCDVLARQSLGKRGVLTGGGALAATPADFR